MSKLVFLLTLIALLVGCTSQSVEQGGSGFAYDPAVTGAPIDVPAEAPSGGAGVVFVETDDPAMLETPEPVTPPPTYRSAPRTYTIRQGDTYYGIAARQLGTGKRWQELARLNPQYPADRLPIGAEIRLPGQ